MSTDPILRSKNLVEKPLGKYVVVDIPPSIFERTYGQFAELLNTLVALPPGKCVQLPRMKIGAMSTLRQAALKMKFRVALRNTPDATYVWKREATQ